MPEHNMAVLIPLLHEARWSAMWCVVTLSVRSYVPAAAFLTCIPYAYEICWSPIITSEEQQSG